MSASEQANAFCREVLASGEVFLIEHELRGPATWPLAASQHARPVWSSRRRIRAMLDGPLAGPGLVIAPHTWEEFRDVLLPGIAEAGLLVGLNWSGPRARGYNLDPADVVARVESYAESRDRQPRPDDGGPGAPENDDPGTRLAG